MTANILAPEPDLEFPSSDGKPMSENTRQYEAIVTLKGNIEAFAPSDAFVAGDHLIYVDRRDPPACQAPDVYVAFGRPRGHRPCYKVWEEDGVFPQVVFEVVAPSNTNDEMERKRAFYFQHGAEEYYEFDPEAGIWTGFVRDPGTRAPEAVPEMDGHTSPRLGMTFGFRPLELRVFRPDGTRFLSFQELEDDRIAQRHRADAERERAADAQRRADAERRRSEEAEQRAEQERAEAEGARRAAEEERQRTAEARRRADDERRRADAERQRADAERQRADAERQRADAERGAAERARREAERVRALLRAAGIDPDATA
jgi:Uma2 family endonuclease